MFGDRVVNGNSEFFFIVRPQNVDAVLKEFHVWIFLWGVGWQKMYFWNWYCE